MLTIFSTPKAFHGHADIIQRNAIKSWTLLHPDAEIILVGDDDGTAEVCKEFNIRHEPEVSRHEKGPKYLDYIFDRAQQVASYNILCYVNCDIILMSDFRQAVEQVSARWQQFLMVGRRWDADITQPLNFNEVSWENGLAEYIKLHGGQRTATWIDYFAFTKNLYHHQMPPFVIGRNSWDPWLVWKAISAGATVVDASRVVVAVHQNHDYSYLPAGGKKKTEDDLARRNQKLSGSWMHWHTTDSASHVLTKNGVRKRYCARWFVPIRQNGLHYTMQLWFCILNFTRPIRHRLGLRKSTLEASR